MALIFFLLYRRSVTSSAICFECIVLESCLLSAWSGPADEPISFRDFKSLWVCGCFTVYEPIASISQLFEVIEWSLSRIALILFWLSEMLLT